MIDPKNLDDLVKKLFDNVPEGVREAQKDFGKNLRAMLESMISRMNLVTRDEFESERQGLNDIEAQIAELQRRIEDLER